MANYRFNEVGPPVNAGTASNSTLTQQVYQMLHEEIVSGTLHPGNRLVRRALSKRMGVSPMPVTEALLRLEVDGLVESRPLYGSRVRPLTIKDVENDQVLREAIECQAARVCAENISESDLSKLMRKARVVDRMMAQGDPQSKLGMQAHLEFHMDVACCGGFASLAEELQRVWFRRLMRLNWLKATRYKHVPKNWHQQIAEAVAGRDADGAEAKMREHVRYGIEDDHRVLEEFLKQG